MKVFLSSTYNDLIEHRRAAHDSLEQLGLHVIWMEAFGARPVESTKACLGEIDECELFVGIYAHRYGYIPEGSDVSITEQEFLHAKSKGKPIFCFIVHEDHPWSPKFVEYQKKENLESFLNHVKKQPIKFFTTPENLANSIASSVGNYLKHSSITAPHKRISSTLPSQPYFFGRERELAAIADAISPESRTWGALIDGPGGIGKSALAIRAAHLTPETLFDRKIFITAKVRELTPEGEKPLTDFSRDNYFSMLNELALELGEEGIPRLSPGERANPLRMAMAGQKNLIIFDNLETLSEEESTRLFQFLSRLPEGNKAIATSRRRRPDIDARAIRLDRMEKKEALQLIGKLAETNPRLARENAEAYTNLYEISNGNPLLIKWVCGQLGREGSAMHTLSEAYEFIGKSPDKNDPLEYIFGDLVESFTTNEINILSALVHFSNPVNIGTIARITRIQQSRIQTSVEDLIDRAILVGDLLSGLCYLPPLTAKFLRRINPQLVEHSISSIRDLACKIIREAEENPSGKIGYLEAEWPLISAALPYLPNGNYRTLQDICKLIGSFLEFSGRWTEWLKLSLQAESRAVALYDWENAGWRALDAGWVYYLLNQPDNVLTYASQAETHWRKSKYGFLENAAVVKLKGMAYQLGQNYNLAIEAFYEAVELQIRIRPESKYVAMSLNDLAEAERLAGNYKAADRELQSALRISRSLSDDEEGTAIYLCNLAGLALDQGNWQLAEKHAREALPIAEVVGRQELIASDCLRLAKAILKQNRLEESVPYLRKAIEIFSRLHSKDLQQAQELLKTIDQESR